MARKAVATRIAPACPQLWARPAWPPIPGLVAAWLARTPRLHEEVELRAGVVGYKPQLAASQAASPEVPARPGSPAPQGNQVRRLSEARLFHHLWSALAERYPRAR